MNNCGSKDFTTPKTPALKISIHHIGFLLVSFILIAFFSLLKRFFLFMLLFYCIFSCSYYFKIFLFIYSFIYFCTLFICLFIHSFIHFFYLSLATFQLALSCSTCLTGCWHSIILTTWNNQPWITSGYQQQTRASSPELLLPPPPLPQPPPKHHHHHHYYPLTFFPSQSTALSNQSHLISHHCSEDIDHITNPLGQL